MTIQTSDWLLTPIQWPQIGSNGKPWGTSTKMSARAQVTNQPWDTGCQVTPLIGGYRAMLEMRKVLEDLIVATGAATAPPPGQRGHVYIADWRLNALRDLSDGNRWKTGPWTKETVPADLDQTAVGLVLRLMQAGVIVRILVWFPTPLQSRFADLGAHIADHQYLSDVVRQENVRLEQQLGLPLGIVGLDARTTDGAVSGSHHQKMMVVRSPLGPEFNVAFCGGVDLAFTRRDAPTDPTTYDPTKHIFLDGDWQSGSGIPGVTPVFENPASAQGSGSAPMLWPPDGTTNYSSLLGVSIPGAASESDLPMQTDDNQDVCLAVGGQWDAAAGTCTYTDYTGSDASGNPTGTQTTAARSIYGQTNQLWHDQHLMLRGPIVSTLEWQFVERWIDRPNPCIKTADPVANRLLAKEKYRGDVLFSTDEAKSNGHVIPLPDPQDEGVVNNAKSTVQMWRTIPMRDSRVPAAGNPPPPGNLPAAVLFDDGEFTVMWGYAKAMSQAQELIWIFDQYFWSEAAARLLNYRVRQQQGLCVILVLPPFADGQYQTIHLARTLALQALMHGLDGGQKGRIGVYNLWKPEAAGGRGIYVHAKAHTYDGALLVCGSANLNRRSLTCDSELACAVLDPDVVSQHQQDLWQLLFGTTAWPNLDLNVSGNGAQFFQQFKTAAGSPGACLVPDPWVDDIFADVAGTLPNGVARTTTFPGPVFEGMYAEALDASSLVRAIEQDVMDAPGPPRAPRLDDLATRVEKKAQVRPDGSVHYDLRKQGEILTGPIITFPAIVYWGRDGYEYAENAEWWRQVTLGLPCFNAFPLKWDGYATNVVEAQLGGHQIVIQLWKGWCQRFAALRGMPGGVGAEVGVYRRIPGKSLPDVLPRQLQLFGDALLTAYQTLTNSGTPDIWWPYPELNPTITFTLTIAKDGHQFFTTGQENTWWACKWMTARSYVNKYRTDVPSAPSLPDLVAPIGPGPGSLTLTYTIECTVNGQTQTLGPNVW